MAQSSKIIFIACILSILLASSIAVPATGLVGGLLGTVDSTLGGLINGGAPQTSNLRQKRQYGYGYPYGGYGGYPYGGGGYSASGAQAQAQSQAGSSGGGIYGK